MISKQESVTSVRDAFAPSFLSPALWRHVVDMLELSSQQARIVSLILQGRADKDIVEEMRLSRYTIRTYLRRIFDRIGVEDRIGLILRVFALCIGRRQGAGCPPFG
jgi:DNA-binding NarL/FixJ family response regulator